jgi:hypothetical protein
MSVHWTAVVKLHTLPSVPDGNEAAAGHTEYWEELLAPVTQ